MAVLHMKYQHRVLGMLSLLAIIAYLDRVRIRIPTGNAFDTDVYPVMEPRPGHTRGAVLRHVEPLVKLLLDSGVLERLENKSTNLLWRYRQRELTNTWGCPNSRARPYPQTYPTSTSLEKWR